MRPLLIAALLPLPALAQEGNESIDEGFDLLGRGLGLLMEGLTEEMTPALDDMAQMLLLLEGIAGEIGEYEAPEMLPNGDIIIRRKVPVEEDEVEL